MSWSPGPASTSLKPGSLFGTRYRIESLLGEGGMGAVYKAYDFELGRIVALKLVRPELASSPQTMQRFKQELLLASRISHKNILRIHDLGDWHGVKFITMAFVEGSDLSGLIEAAGRLPFEMALRFTRQLCAALEAAHSEGVVHRDLKPQNILIDRADNIYISDFGLAKSLESEATMMTRTGQILGTPRYMSPEQVEAKDVDHRSDIYSLGLILYEMFTSGVPFRGESSLQLMYQRVNEKPVDPRSVCPELPEYVARIILKCLEKDPARRYQSAREILDDLESERAPEGAAPDAVRTISIQLPRPSHRWWLPALGGLILAAALVMAVPGTRHWMLREVAGARATSGQPAIQRYLAVLPFRLVGDEANTKYLADGVVDSLSAKLAALKNVHVASSDTVAATFTKQDPAKIARTLGVTLLVQGTVQSSADKIAITVTMDDLAKGGRTLLHQDFSGVREDLLTLEDRVFGALVSALAIKPSNEEMARTALRPTEDIGAYDLYLKGRNLWRGAQNAASLQKAAEFFDRALQLDPRFALAYTGLADAYLRMWDQTKDSAWTQKALGAAHQAQALNDNLPEVHFVLGSIYTATGLTGEAIAELQRALQLAPNSDESLRRLGRAYAAAGRQQEAIAAYTRAIQVNPYLWTNYNFLGQQYFKLGDNDKALEAFQHITELEPDRASGYANVGAVYYRQGRWTECIPMFQKAIALQPSPLYYSNLGTTLFFTGRYAEAAAMFEKAAEMKPNDASIRGNLADAYRWAGQTAKAAATYDQAISLAFKSFQVNPRDTQALGNLAIYYAKKGDGNRASGFIRQARGIDRTDNALMYDEATVHALAGRNREALANLGEALRNGYSMQEASSDPELKNLRQTAEFGRLQQELSAKASK